MNDRMDGIEKARALAIEVEAPLPPSLCDLEDLMLPVNALVGAESTMRVWDSGATSGMTKPGTTDGKVVSGRWARVMTGAGPVKTNQWVEEDLAWGKLRHIGLEQTTNTACAGQHNSELGVQTSWLEPEAPGPNSPCGPCLIHKPAGGHIVWQGEHRIQIPQIVRRTLEVGDNTPIHTISGDFCATANCNCGLPKLTTKIEELSGNFAALAGSDEEWPEEAVADVPADASERPAVAAKSEVAAAPESASASIENFDVERARMALHGADGNRCGCELCRATKQQRHPARQNSHPHSEDKIRRSDGVHSFGCVAMYWDIQDYGAETEFIHKARYDVLGYCVSTATIICIPMKSKLTGDIEAAVKSRLGPTGQFHWTRSDDAPELNNALENCGAKHFPSPPHSPNANITERVALGFGDLQRMVFAQSGCPPYWRPIVGISSAQQWNIHRQTARRDIDGNESARTPMHWRHSLQYNPVDQATALLCAQMVTVVPPKLSR